MIRFGKREKLSLRYIGPYEVVERVGHIAYRLALLPKLVSVHDMIHVSMLQRYKSDLIHVL